MESLFRQFGIYADQGQLYRPHDAEMFLYYKESKDGQILEEGITEAGCPASCTAAGTAYANYGVEMIPFFIYYSMFGFQRVGDLIWAFGDARGKGFLCGGTDRAQPALAGEGTAAPGRAQPRRCSSHRPHLRRVRSGLCLRDRHHRSGRHPAHVRTGARRLAYYYLTLSNENYAMPAMPAGLNHGGVFCAASTAIAGRGKRQSRRWCSLFGSGPILNEALRAQTADPGRALRRARRRMERHQLQRTAARRPGGGALEPPPSRPQPRADALHRRSPAIRN